MLGCSRISKVDEKQTIHHRSVHREQFVSGTYKATGINLKAMPIGENDRLLTILTSEYGLIRAIAPGARKPKSSLGGRSALFVVNHLLIARGRSLDKITQAETVSTYQGLSTDLGKLVASQYLAEIVLEQALGEHPQEELFQLFNLHLGRLETLSGGNNQDILAHLCQGIFHLLALGGIAPQVHSCCITKHSIAPEWGIPHWQCGFSIESGATLELSAGDRVTVTEPNLDPSVTCSHRLNALDLLLFQHLSDNDLDGLATAIAQHSPTISEADLTDSWRRLEKILRQYIHYHLDTRIKSATSIDFLN
jgi:DNA repair protein RecO (recombination protein O)